MKISIRCTYPHEFPYREHLEDHIQAAMYSIRKLGWSTHRQNPDATLLFGAHLPYCRPEDCEGTIVVNTERVVSNFVHGDFEKYLAKLRYAKAVWNLYEDDTEFLGEHVHAFTWNYGPDVFPCLVPPDADPVCDLAHFGSITPHRKETLASLANAGLTLATAFKLPWLDRAYKAGLAKAQLALAFDDKADYLPWPRIVWARAQRLLSLTNVPTKDRWGALWCDEFKAAEEAKALLQNWRPENLNPYSHNSHNHFEELIHASR